MRLNKHVKLHLLFTFDVSVSIILHRKVELHTVSSKWCILPTITEIHYMYYFRSLMTNTRYTADLNTMKFLKSNLRMRYWHLNLNQFLSWGFHLGNVMSYFWRQEWPLEPLSKKGGLASKTYHIHIMYFFVISDLFKGCKLSSHINTAIFRNRNDVL